VPVRFGIEDPTLAGPLRQSEQGFSAPAAERGWDEYNEKQLDGIFPSLDNGLAFARQRLGLPHHL